MRPSISIRSAFSNHFSRKRCINRGTSITYDVNTIVSTASSTTTNLESWRRFVPKTLTIYPLSGQLNHIFACVLVRKLYLGAFHAPLPYRSDPLMLSKVWLEQICAKHSPTKITKPTRQKITIIFSFIFVTWYDHDGRTGLALDITLLAYLDKCFPKG